VPSFNHTAVAGLFVFQTRNIRSLELHLQKIVSTPAHAIFLTEADVPEHRVFAVRKQLADNDKQVLYGQATSLSSNNEKRQGRRIAVVADKSVSLVELHPGNDIEHLFL
jgi:hypothetical protein